MGLLKRLLGSLIDKLLVVLFFIIVYFSIRGSYVASGELGYFTNLLVSERFGNVYQSLDKLCLQILLTFIICNMLYYFIAEAIFKSSIGKYVCGGVLVDGIDDSISVSKAFTRSLALGLLMVGAVITKLMFCFLSYMNIIFLFFIILDISVLYCKRSLVDIITRTYCINRKNNNTDKYNKMQEDTNLVSSNLPDKENENSNKEETIKQEKSSILINKISYKKRLLVQICFALVFVLCAYIAINNVKPMKNLISFKEYNEANFVDYDEEKLSVINGSKFFKHFDYKTLDNPSLSEEFGPIPGKNIISTIVGQINSTYSYKEDHEWYYYNVTVPFNYVYDFTVFEPSMLADDNLLYNKFKEKLSSYKYKEYNLLDCNAKPLWDKYNDSIPQHKQALSYMTVDENGQKMLRCIFYANQRGYMLEVHSDYCVEKIAKQILKEFSAIYLPDYNEKADGKIVTVVSFSVLAAIMLVIIFLIPMVSCKKQRLSKEQGKLKYILCSFSVVLLSILIVTYFIYNANIFDSKESVNTLYTYTIVISLLWCSSLFLCYLLKGDKYYDIGNIWLKRFITYLSVMIIVNSVFCYVDIDAVITKRVIFDDVWWVFFIIGFYTLVINCATLPYAVYKCYDKESRFFLQPSFVEKYMNYRNVSEVERKSFVAIILYPFFVIGNFMLGSALVAAFFLPATLLFIAIIEIKMIRTWINKSDENKAKCSNLSANAIFKDYYIILDINENATENDVIVAFNKAMAKYNSVSGLKSNKSFLLNIQEAYFVLSSTNRLRPEYDKEYLLYRKSNARNYKYTNATTENDILSIQQNLSFTNIENTHSCTKINKLTLSIIISILILILCLVGGSLYIYANSTSVYKKYTGTKSDGDDQCDFDFSSADGFDFSR